MNTKELILDTAEMLFAQQGFEAVSVRDIVGAAGANISAISYHFGSKEDLILAVIARRINPVNQARLNHLSKLREEYQEAAIPLEEILAAFFNPVFKLGEDESKKGSKAMKVLGLIMSSPNSGLKEKLFAMFAEVAKEFLTELKKALPNLDGQTLAYRFYFAVGSMAHFLMNQEVPNILKNKMTGKSGQRLDFKEIQTELTNFIIGGLNAQ